jgi:carbonic anhydrase/acetyltransferase-like protein (isoleucine patch superfamily)
VEDGAFVGMGATLLDGVVVEQGAFVAAGSMVTENTRIPAGQVFLISSLGSVLSSVSSFSPSKGFIHILCSKSHVPTKMIFLYS